MDLSEDLPEKCIKSKQKQTILAVSENHLLMKTPQLMPVVISLLLIMLAKQSGDGGVEKIR